MTSSEFINKFKSKYLWGNIGAMILVLVLLCVGVKFGIDIYTHHGEAIRVPDIRYKKIEDATGIETRATILGHLQRGGSPTARDRFYASMMGAYAVDVIDQGRKNRLIGYKNGKLYDVDVDEAFAMTKSIDEYEYEIARVLGTRE